MLFVARRLLAACGVILGTITLVFFILYWLPGDPAAMVAGDDASPAMVANIREKLGTTAPLWQQYLTYLTHLAHGDFGTSFTTNEPVWHRLAAQLPATLQLTFCACLVAITLGLILGLLAAVNRDSWLDHLLQTTSMFFTSMPSFWFGLLLILIFSVGLRWLPAVGSGSFRQLILPALCLGVQVSSWLAGMVRNSVIDVLDEPFITTLRGKGLRERQILATHVMRNALIPVVTMFGLLAGELISSTVVVETIFARQGLGRLLVESVGVKDIPVVMGVTIFASSIFVVINLLVDLSYLWIDPRIKA
jgi:peptide/nickel transport system permease protein